MTVYVTAISPSHASDHRNITHIRWLSSLDSTSNIMTTAETIDWLDKGNILVVAGTKTFTNVEVVRTNPPYLRTKADGTTTDNLLSLPRF